MVDIGDSCREPGDSLGGPCSRDLVNVDNCCESRATADVDGTEPVEPGESCEATGVGDIGGSGAWECVIEGARLVNGDDR